MRWQDKGYLLSLNKYNENSAIAEFFTENNGKVSGVIFGASSKKIKSYLFVHFWTRFLNPCATPCPWKASPSLLGGGRRWYAAWRLQ